MNVVVSLFCGLMGRNSCLQEQDAKEAEDALQKGQFGCSFGSSLPTDLGCKFEQMMIRSSTYRLHPPPNPCHEGLPQPSLLQPSKACIPCHDVVGLQQGNVNMQVTQCKLSNRSPLSARLPSARPPQSPFPKWNQLGVAEEKLVPNPMACEYKQTHTRPASAWHVNHDH